MKPDYKLHIPSLKCQRIGIFQCHCQFSPVTMSRLEQRCKICFLTKLTLQQLSSWEVEKKALLEMAVSDVIASLSERLFSWLSWCFRMSRCENTSRRQTHLPFLNLFPGESSSLAGAEECCEDPDQSSAQEGRIPSGRVWTLWAESWRLVMGQRAAGGMLRAAAAAAGPRSHSLPYSTLSLQWCRGKKHPCAPAPPSFCNWCHRTEWWLHPGRKKSEGKSLSPSEISELSLQAGSAPELLLLTSSPPVFTTTVCKRMYRSKHVVTGLV